MNISYELYPVTGLILTGYIIINQKKVTNMVTIGINYIDMSEIGIRKPTGWDYRTVRGYSKNIYYMLMKQVRPDIIIQIISSNKGQYGGTNRVEIKRLLIQPFYDNIANLSNDQIINMTLNVELIDVMDNPYRENVQLFIKDTIKKYGS